MSIILNKRKRGKLEEMSWLVVEVALYQTTPKHIRVKMAALYAKICNILTIRPRAKINT